ncbi:MAG: hypothetical protein AAFX76_08305 [Planctomycetota bacterium]
MARARTGGGAAGSIWGLVVFGAGFLVCLILAIVFYTRVETAEQAAAAAQAELNTALTSADRNNPAYQTLTAEGSGSAVGKLLAEVDRLRSEVSGLQGQVGTVTVARDTAQASLEDQQAAAARAQQELADAVAEKNELSTDLGEQVQQLTGTVNEISAENTRLRGLIDTSIAEVDQQYRDQITGLRQQVSELDGTITERERTIEDQRGIIEDLRGLRPETVSVTLADATIVAQIEDQNKVYLDIGRDAGLSLGLPFKVYDPDEVIKIEDPDSEGKAVVEIINIESNNAIGRIVSRQPRASVNNGDVLVNVAFDPDRQFTFHVFGQFDLDFDGDVESDGNERVSTLVRRYGGRLADELGFDVDYLVLGQEPPLPQRPDDELDLIRMREFRVELSNFEAYQTRIAEARELGVPILNQNRFLDLVGYFEQ